MSKFDEIVREFYQKEFLLEFPGQTGMSTTEPYDFEFFNKKEAAELTKTERVDTFKFNGANLKLHRDHYNNDLFSADTWILNNDFIACYFIFEKLHNGLRAGGVWNHKTFKGLCRKLIFNYYLKKFDFIISDNNHTDDGEGYWRKIIDEGFKRGHVIRIIYDDGREIDLQPYQLSMNDEIWGKSDPFYSERIKIYSLNKFPQSA